MNIPNALSVVRIVLIPIFLWVYLLAGDQQGMYLLAAGVLLLSALTDMLDGMIARRCNMITDLGKVLDPIADKLTLGAVTVCLWIKMPFLWPLFVCFLLKEFFMMIGGIILYRKQVKISGARWFGKVYTVIFYCIVLAVIAFPQMPRQMIATLFCIMVFFTLFTLVMYIPVFFQLKDHGEKRDVQHPAA